MFSLNSTKLIMKKLLPTPTRSATGMLIFHGDLRQDQDQNQFPVKSCEHYHLQKTIRTIPHKLEIRPNHIELTIYTKGCSHSFKNVSRKHGIQVYFKGGKTSKSLLVAPKVKDSITQKGRVIYRYKCDSVECDG